MAKAPRTVQCYLCGHRFEVPAKAQSTSCPKCHKALIVGDVVVKGLKGPLREVRTCGRITVGTRGRILAELVEAHAGIKCDGVIEAKRVVSGWVVALGAKSQLKGALAAPVVTIAKGARITVSRFECPSDPLKVSDLHRALHS